MKSFKRLLVFFPGLLLVVLVACVSPGGKVSPGVEAPRSGLAPAPRAGWEATWEGWKAEARKDGKLMIYGTAKPLVYQALARGLKDNFGIELDGVTGRSAEIEQKILTEYRAGIHIPDVWTSGGANTTVFIFRPLDMMWEMDPFIILPDVRDDKMWYEGSFDKGWNDPYKISYTFVAAVDIPLAINTNLVRPGEIKSLEDLLDPRWKGKMILNDPTTSGKGNQSFVMIGWKIRSWDYWRAIAKQEPVVTRDTRLASDWLAKGRYPILISPSTSAAAPYIEAGAPIAFVRFEGGGYVSHSGGTVALLKKAPHPNASKVFLNWLLTKEGQMAWSKADQTQSRRVDVPTNHLEAIRIRDPKAKYFSTSEWDYVSRDQKKDEDLAREIFGHLIGR